VGDLLSGAPVELVRVRARDDGAVELDLERDVEGPRLLLEVRQRGRVLGRAARARQLGQRDHPVADRGRERLAQEGAERHGLPALDVAGAPVVEQDDAEHVLECALDGHRPATPAGPADHEAELELDVEAARRPVLPRPEWAMGPQDGRAARDDRPGAAVVANRQVAPVRGQRLPARAEDAPRVGRVVQRRVEVDVVRDREGQVQVDRGERVRGRVVDRGRGRPRLGPGPHQGIERGRR
jgi:hypothetical protein